MKIGGIVAEYNPFHNGHKYQLQKSVETGELTHTVAVMSSNYVQRGEAAILSKWARAEMAVKNGVDLVIELPTLWSTSYAQRFALGAVSLLDALGCVDALSFGSETGNIDELIACKNAINSEEVKENYDTLEGKEVSVAGRMMSKRIMGKASFCHVQDLQGTIQV